jgi:hypothetical protein
MIISDYSAGIAVLMTHRIAAVLVACFYSEPSRTVSHH